MKLDEQLTNSEGGHDSIYSPVNIVLGGTLFTGEFCLGGHYSLLYSVSGDILLGDTPHWVLSHISIVVL